MRAAVIAATLLLAGPAVADTFTFAALGDMPYVREDDRVADPEAPRNRQFAQLIERINAARPAFSIHVGDTKAGNTTCTDAHLALIKRLFGRFQAPLFYTPGDNEWTDCGRMGADPVARLARVREEFFAAPGPLGAALQAGFPENRLWTRDGVVFATLHVVGSNNDRALPDEYGPRNAADLAWLRGAFARARETSAPALVLAMQANPGWYCTRPECAGFPPLDTSGSAGLVAALAAELDQFARPVLLIHGDTHVFTVDKPLRRGHEVVPNFTRLEVFGEDDTHAVLVTVDTADPEVFSFKPLMR